MILFSDGDGIQASMAHTDLTTVYECRKLRSMSREMVFIIAHFDDSGTHPESSFAVAACILASVQQWRKFNRDWERAEKIEKFGTFHMADFVAGYQQFMGWDVSKKKRVLRRLCRIISDHARAGWATAVRKEDYDAVIKEPFRAYAGRFHYTFCVRQCATHVGVWRQERQKPCSLGYVFDRMNKGGKGEIMHVMDSATGLSGYGFDDKANIFPLQAADIFAWTTLQKLHEQLHGKPESSFAEIAFNSLSQAGLKFGFFIESNLKEWAKEESAEWEKHNTGSGPVTAA